MKKKVLLAKKFVLRKKLTLPPITPKYYFYVKESKNGYKVFDQSDRPWTTEIESKKEGRDIINMLYYLIDREMSKTSRDFVKQLFEDSRN